MDSSTKNEKENQKKWKLAIELLKWIAIIIIGVLIIVGILFKQPSQDSVTFQVVGYANETNTTALTSLHYECMKYCAEKFYNSDFDRGSCWEQCASLGKEGCTI